jgi:hypothetical protein
LRAHSKGTVVGEGVCAKCVVGCRGKCLGGSASAGCYDDGGMMNESLISCMNVLPRDNIWNCS